MALESSFVSNHDDSASELVVFRNGRAAAQSYPHQMSKKQESKLTLIPPERIEHAILLIRGQKVLVDADLARLSNAPAKSPALEIR